MTSPQIYQDNGSFYLVQDLDGLDELNRAKAITNFVSKSTKLLELYLDSELEKIFVGNFILLKDKEKKTIVNAINQLKELGKQIEIKDLFSGKDFYKCRKIAKTKGNMTIVLEDDRFLQCGVKISEGIYEI